MSAPTSRLFRPRLLDYLQHYSVSEFRDDLAAGVVVGIALFCRWPWRLPWPAAFRRSPAFSLR